MRVINNCQLNGGESWIFVCSIRGFRGSGGTASGHWRFVHALISAKWPVYVNVYIKLKAIKATGLGAAVLTVFFYGMTSLPLRWRHKKRPDELNLMGLHKSFVIARTPSPEFPSDFIFREFVESH